MAGKLVVLVRPAGPGGWSVGGAALDAVSAQPIVDTLLAANPGGRVVVAQVIRSFQATVVAAEDAIPVVTP